MNATSYDGTQLCDLGNVTQDCTCDKGVDKCVLRGKCVGFCTLKQTYLDAANAALAHIKCAGPYADCGKGMQCKQSSLCQELTCDDKKGIVQTPCYGFCMVADRKVLSARMDNNGRTIVLVLNTAAAPGSFACALLFDTATMNKLGKEAWCSVQDSGVTVQLGPSATFLPGTDTLTLAASQAVLVDLLLITSKFTGSNVPVATCDACIGPDVKLLGPQVRTACTAQRMEQ